MEFAFDTDSRGADLVSVGSDADIRPQSDGSFSARQLQRFLHDVRFEPNWRRDAELESAFYDGDQLKTETVRRMIELGIAPMVVNMIAPAIDSVAGLEVLSRSALKVEPETEESFDVAQGMNVKFKEAQRLTGFNERTGSQYKEGVQIGISWVEVKRNPDPFAYPYQVLGTPWRECFVDYRSREPDYSDRRFFVRAKWFDLDTLARHFPMHKNLIRTASLAGGGAEGWLDWETLGYENAPDHNRVHAVESDRRFTLEEDEWRQQHRGRIRLYEIEYYVPTVVEALRFDNGRVVQLDRQSPVHLEALRRDLAEYVKGPTKIWRQAFFIGPYRLIDRPLEANRPRYTPMVGFRRGSDGAPYGLIRRMRAAQEAINARYSRMLYDLASRKYFIDDDAVHDPDQTAKELNKVTSMVVMRADRKGEAGIVAVPATDTSPITYQMLQEAKQNIFDVTGLHPEFQGRTLEAGRSGVAIEQLVEQTTQVLGVVYDNHRTAKRMAGETLLAYQMADLGKRNNLEVETDPASDGRKKKIILNARAAEGLRDNDVLLARMRVALGTAPDTVTYAQQKFRSLVEVVKSLPENLQAVMVDFVVRAANLPDGEEMLERIRQITGFGPEPRDPEAREALAAQQAQQAQLEQKMQALEMAMAEAELAVTQAKAALEAAKADKTADADTELTDAKTVLSLAQALDIEREQERKGRETSAKAIEGAARLRQAANPPAPAKTTTKK